MFKLLLQNFIKANGRSPNAIEMLQLKFKAASQANKGKVIQFPQKRDFAAEIKAMMDDGTIKVGQVDKKNDNVLTREMFKDSNLNNPEPVTIKSGVSNSQLNKNKAIDQGIKVEPVSERFIQFTIQDIKKKEPIEGMKIANQIIKREGDFVDLTEEQSKKILTEVNDHIMGVDLPIGPEDLAKGGRAGYQTGNQVMPAVDPRMQNTYEQNIKLNQIQRNMQDRVRKGSKTQGLEIGQLGDMYGKKATPYPMNSPDLKPNEANLYGAATNMGLRPEQIKAVAYYNTLKNNFGDQGIGMAGPSMGLANIGSPASGTNPFGSEQFFKTPAEQFALYQEGLRQQLLQGSPEIYFDSDKTYDAGDYVSPKGIYTFRDDEFLRNLYNNNTMTVDGKEYASEQDAIEDMGIERYNQFMAKGGRAGFAGGLSAEITNKNLTLPKSIEIYKRFNDGKEPSMQELLKWFKDNPRYQRAASGGRAGYYTGGMVDVEPNLSDIGHGSDALMARTRLVAPDSQATTSTGLNYLLAEDNDNIRVPFSAGGGGRRAFLKLLATLGGATAAVKSGFIGLGEGTAKKAVTETVKQSAGSGYPPPYFYKLVEKIKFMGDDTLATKDKAIAKKYKDYVMEEDFAGNIEIIKKGDNVSEDVFMSLKVDEVPIKGKKGSRKVEEYEEYTARPDAEGKMKDIEQGVPDEVIDEAGDTTAMTLKKANGGRIGFRVGGSPRKFLEKVFGKDKFKNMIENDPELEQGMLEVVEMFRSKDKESLKMYLQKFLPHMDDAEIENFIIGGGDTAGIEGQLIRLGSGRDYKGKLDMIEEANNVRKLEDFDIEGVSKNAEGGRIGFSGGGIFRAIIANSAKKAGMTPYQYIKATSYKSLPQEVKMFMSKADFEKLKLGQEKMYSNYIDMAKTRQEFQKNIEGGKNTPAKELFEDMEKTMDEQSFVPKNVTSDDIAEMELMVKNRFNKGRKDNAKGGLQTMLGE